MTGSLDVVHELTLAAGRVEDLLERLVELDPGVAQKAAKVHRHRSEEACDRVVLRVLVTQMQGRPEIWALSFVDALDGDGFEIDGWVGADGTHHTDPRFDGDVPMDGTFMAWWETAAALVAQLGPRCLANPGVRVDSRSVRTPRYLVPNPAAR